VAIPDGDRHAEPDFAHHAPEPVTGPGWEARVFIGSLLGDESPVPTYSPLLGAELLLEPGTALVLDVDSSFEHGVLVDTGSLDVSGRQVGKDELAYVPLGSARLELRAAAGDEPVRLLLLGGEPFGESIVMWWNFVARTHEEIVAFRDEWQAQITAGGAVVTDGQDLADGRFGIVVGEHLPPIPAPPLPNARLKERR
jgi:redox-sensitive bicupin YhaK (pirin superfamily)